MNRRLANLWMVGVALVMLGAGCTHEYASITPLMDQQDFQEKVLQSSKPVLVEFYKDSCPTCVLQEAVMDKLTAEYEGRVAFTKFKITKLDFSTTSRELKDRYKLFWVPTVLLFVDGQEVKRWELNHLGDEFRTALDDVLAAPTAKRSLATPAQPAKIQPAAWGAAPDPKKCIEGQGCQIE